MRCITVNLKERSYPIAIGSGLLDRLHEFIAPLTPTSISVVTNTVVGPLYAQRAQQALAGVPTHVS